MTEDKKGLPAGYETAAHARPVGLPAPDLRNVFANVPPQCPVCRFEGFVYATGHIGPFNRHGMCEHCGKVWWKHYIKILVEGLDAVDDQHPAPWKTRIMGGGGSDYSEVFWGFDNRPQSYGKRSKIEGRAKRYNDARNLCELLKVSK